jgi:hypothetical protein
VVDTKVTDPGWNPVGTGPPAGWVALPVDADVVVDVD